MVAIDLSSIGNDHGDLISHEIFDIRPGKARGSLNQFRCSELQYIPLAIVRRLTGEE